MSILVAAIAIPAYAAKTSNPRAGFRQLVIGTLLFNLGYALALRFVWGKF